MGEQNSNKAAQSGQQNAANANQQGLLNQSLGGITNLLQTPLGRGPLAGFAKQGGFQGPPSNPLSGMTINGNTMGGMGPGGPVGQMSGPGQAGAQGGMPPNFMQMLMQMLQGGMGGQNTGGLGTSGGGNAGPGYHYPGGAPPQPNGPPGIRGVGQPPSLGGQNGGGPPMHYPGGGPPQPNGPFPVQALGQQLSQGYQPPQQNGRPSVSLG
jgi:hypothetical protein